jgi:hypothetical protein
MGDCFSARRIRGNLYLVTSIEKPAGHKLKMVEEITNKK